MNFSGHELESNDFNNRELTEKDSNNVSVRKSVSEMEKSAQTKKSRKNVITDESVKQNNENEKSEKNYSSVPKKVPLLEQPAIVEGCRNRKTIFQHDVKNILSKGTIEIPNGKGIPLGRIPIINSRFKRLRIDEVKHLHRLLFDRLGNPANLTSNIQKFRGFTFQEDSNQYSKKLKIINKLNMSVIKELLFFLDLDIKIKKKDDAVKTILEFLMCPKRAEKSVNQPVLSHPKRRATKRNYFERNDEDDIKKRKKIKSAKSSKEDKNNEKNDVNEEEGKSTKTIDKEFTNLNEELKKPAKKRKKNQLIDDQEEIFVQTVVKTTGKSIKNTKNSQSSVKNVTDIKLNSETHENIENKDGQLTDEELKNFLKKILADANLEKTTMKTVYNLISTHYPNYNYLGKKDLIKNIVKSLIQS